MGADDGAVGEVVFVHGDHGAHGQHRVPAFLRGEHDQVAVINAETLWRARFADRAGFGGVSRAVGDRLYLLAQVLGIGRVARLQADGVAFAVYGDTNRQLFSLGRQVDRYATAVDRVADDQSLATAFASYGLKHAVEVGKGAGG